MNSNVGEQNGLDLRSGQLAVKESGHKKRVCLAVLAYKK